MTNLKTLTKQGSKLSVRSIGTGEIAPSPVAKNTKQTVFAETETDDSYFVVKGFKSMASKWLNYETPETTNAAQEMGSRTNSSSISSSSSLGDDELKFDLTTDLAFHNSAEREGAELVRKALTPEEQNAMPDDFMPLRHYRAEKGDVEKAITKIKNTLRWRKEFQVDKIVSALEDDAKGASSNGGEDFAAMLRKENETGKIYVRGYDKDGRAMMYMRPGNENTLDETNNMRHLVFQLEKAVACSQKNGHGKICLVIDYDGFSMSKTPSMSASRNTLTILQDHFCERMFRAYICNPPFVFRTFYNMIKPFVDPVTKQKVCWCVGKAGLEQIVDDVGGAEIAAKQLEKCLGGGDVREFDSVEYNLQPLNMAFDEGVNY